MFYEIQGRKITLFSILTDKEGTSTETKQSKMATELMSRSYKTHCYAYLETPLKALNLNYMILGS